MTDPNRTLAERAAAGDREALGQLLAEHLPTLRAFVRLRAGRSVRAREADSDLVQSVCRDVLEKGEGFRYPDDSGFKRWLYTTTLRKVMQKNAKYRAACRDGGVEASPSAVADEDLLEGYRRFASPSGVAIGREDVQQIEAALERLSDDDREVILLSRLAGLSRADVALEMGRSEGAIRNLLHRALAKLAIELHRA